jgi:signal peptidase
LSKALKNSYVQTAILVIILLSGVFGFWFGLRTVLRTEYPLLAVASGSMVPNLNVGDLIVVQGVSNGDEINVGPPPNGTMIVFHRPDHSSGGGFMFYVGDELIVHRARAKVYENGTWYFTTQGDANAGSAYWEIDFPESLIVGKVVGVVPWIGNVPLFMRTTQGMIFIFFLFIVILLIEYIPEILKKPRTEKQGVQEGRESYQG